MKKPFGGDLYLLPSYRTVLHLFSSHYPYSSFSIYDALKRKLSLEIQLRSLLDGAGGDSQRGLPLPSYKTPNACAQAWGSLCSTEPRLSAPQADDTWGGGWDTQDICLQKII